MAAKSETPTIRGDKWRSAYRAQVVSLLGSDAPPVSSRGKRFFNRDMWHFRVFTSILCKWIVGRPGTKPTRDDLKKMVVETNATARPRREIVIARTPDRLTVRTGFALIGGSIHEAGHTYYSRRSPIAVADVAWILDVWDSVPEWNRFHAMIQRWSNVIEDIRIERLLRVEFPGCFVKLHDLQDFILRMEAEGEENARSHGANTRGALSIVMRTFRDVGLGYVTPTQEAALEKYRADNPEAVELVLNGPLSGLLRETIALGEDDDGACLRLAFEVIAALYAVSSKIHCPACGARGSKLTITPKRDADGNKVKGKRIVTCSVCGWADEMDVPEDEEDEEDEPVDDIRFEDPKQEDDEPEEGKSGSGGEGAEDSAGSGEPEGDDSDEADSSEGGEGSDSKGDDTDESDSDGAGEGSEDDDSDAQGDAGDAGSGEPEGEDGDDDGADSDAQSGGSEEAGDDSDDGAEGAGSEGAEDPSTNDDSDGNTSGSDDGPEDPGDIGGGHSEGKDQVDNDWSDIADDALEGADDDLGIHDNESALEEAVNEAQETEEKRDGVKDGEAPYHPYDTGLDDVQIVPASYSGKGADDERARTILGSVRKEAAFFRSRLRQIVRAAEMTGTVHGVRRGRDLSDRYLVDTKASLVAGEKPNRAFYAVDEKVETSIAVVIEIDESYSMKRRLVDATRMCVALAEPIDALGGAVMAAGFRDGRGASGIDADAHDGCHRVHGVTHDVFKTFDEPFRVARHRFANTQAEGGTPMADGVQFALDALSERAEAVRVAFVITDGAPNTGHTPVIKRQIRLAKKAGIHVIGVGVGSGAQRVADVFDDYVYSPRFADAPRLLVKKLNEVVDSKMLSRRGRRVAKTG